MRKPAVFILVTLLLQNACSEQPAGRDGFKRPPAVVATTQAAMRPLTVALEAIGTARANESVVITAKVTDTVSKVRFDDGAVVSAGQVLVELTSEEEAALLAEAEANVKDAHTQYERLANLLEQQSIPVSQVDEANARLQAAQARQASIEARLKDRLVKAPFDGLLGFRMVSEGSLLTASTPITTLDDIALIKLDFSVPEVQLGRLAPGQVVIATNDAYPDQQFPATVQTIGSRVDPTTRAVIARAHVPNKSGLLRPGMLLKVRVILSETDVLMIPETALQLRGEQVFVFLIDEGLARIHEVDIGRRQAGWVEVMQGLELGQIVISDGVIKVRDNVPVRILGTRQVKDRGDVAF